MSQESGSLSNCDVIKGPLTTKTGRIIDGGVVSPMMYLLEIAIALSCWYGACFEWQTVSWHCDSFVDGFFQLSKRLWDVNLVDFKMAVLFECVIKLTGWLSCSYRFRNIFLSTSWGYGTMSQRYWRRNPWEKNWPPWLLTVSSRWPKWSQPAVTEPWPGPWLSCDLAPENPTLWRGVPVAPKIFRVERARLKTGGKITDSL